MNDEVINYYLVCLSDEFKNEDILFITSHFYTKLIDEGNTNQYTFSNVKNWKFYNKNKPCELLEAKQIFVPINYTREHWGLAVILRTESKIQYYDSMKDNGSLVMENLEKYIKESSTLRGVTVQDTWQHTCEDAPVQKGNTDCGVYLCMFARLLSLEEDVLPAHGMAKEFRLYLAGLLFDDQNTI